MKPGLRRSLGAQLSSAPRSPAPSRSPPRRTVVRQSGERDRGRELPAGHAAPIWDVPGAGSAEIRGFATDISADQGQTVEFKIDTPAGMYRLDIYRLGYYGGDGARKVDTVTASSAGRQPDCREEVDTGLIDCGTGRRRPAGPFRSTPSQASTSLTPSVRSLGRGEPHRLHRPRRRRPLGRALPDLGRDLAGLQPVRGNSLYVGNPVGRAFKVSYNRPFTTRGSAPEDWLFNAEYPMIRWLERNAYDVSYFTGVDADRLGRELREHRAFLSVGHDEYWSGQQRLNVEAARGAGLNLAFFSGNEVFWKTRWEDGYRTLVCYKATHGTPARSQRHLDRHIARWSGVEPRGGEPRERADRNQLRGERRHERDRGPGGDGDLRLWRNTTSRA